MNLGGRVISFGYDSVGMSAKRGFEKIAICPICHSGDHNDTIAVVEQYTQPCLEWEGGQVSCYDKQQIAV